jgi:hypothetical protein
MWDSVLNLGLLTFAASDAALRQGEKVYEVHTKYT